MGAVAHRGAGRAASLVAPAPGWVRSAPGALLPALGRVRGVDGDDRARLREQIRTRGHARAHRRAARRARHLGHRVM